MDRKATTAGILSLSIPGVHLGDDAKARILARQVNDEFASYIAKQPARFGAFAAVPLPDVDGACREAEFALDTMQLDGIGLFASYNGRYVGLPEFDPLFEILNRRSAVVLIHPTNHPSTTGIRTGSSPGIGNFLVEFLFDTTRAALNLIFFDVLQRFPNIRFILSHAGGTLPYVGWRVAEIASRQMTQPPWETQYPSPFMARHGQSLTPDLFVAELRRFWYDTALSAGRQTLVSLKEVAHPNRIVFGSDWPYAPEVITEDSLKARYGSGVFSDTEQQSIDRENSLQLFPRFG
jgi:6-methylsalicylate decarboxylase